MPKTARSAPLDVAQQPLDLGRREVGVEDEAGALADQRLVTGRAQLGAARRRCAGPARPAPGAAARPCRRVPGDDGLALVGDPDRVEVAALMPASTIASTATRRRHLPDFGRVVLDPARLREVLLELRVGAAGDPRPRGRRRGRSCPSSPGRSRGSGSDSADDREQALGARPKRPPPVANRRSPIPYISATIVRAWRARLRHLEHLQRRRGDPFVGLEAAQRGLAQGRVAGRLQVQLDLGQLLDPVADSSTTRSTSAAICSTLGSRRRSSAAISSWRATSSPTKSSRLSRSRIHLAGEVVGERAERDPAALATRGW